MLSGLFRSMKLSSWVYFYVVAISLLASMFFLPYSGSLMSGSPLLIVIFGKITNALIQRLILLTCLFVLAHVSNKLVFRFKLSGTSSVFPALMLMLSGVLLLSQWQWDPVLIGSAMIAMTSTRLFAIKQQGPATGHIFNTGIFISIASMIYFPFIVFLLIAWFTMILWGRMTLREWLISVSAFAMPYVLMFSWLFWTNQLTWSLIEHFNFTINWISLHNLTTEQIIRMVVWTGLLLISLFAFVLHAGRKSIETRSNYTTILWILFIGIFLSVSMPGHFMAFAWLTAFAGSIFIADFLISLPGRISTLVFILIYFLALSGQYLSFVVK